MELASLGTDEPAWHKSLSIQFTSGRNSCILGLTGDQAEYSPEGDLQSSMSSSGYLLSSMVPEYQSLGAEPKSNKLEKEVSEPAGQWTPQTSPAVRRECPVISAHVQNMGTANPNTYCDNGKVFFFFTLNFDHVSSLAV